MRKSDTLRRKAKSTRNRHNGRVNADKMSVAAHKNTQRIQMDDGRVYQVLPYARKLPNLEIPGTLAHFHQEENPQWLVKSRIIREVMGVGNELRTDL